MRPSWLLMAWLVGCSGTDGNDSDPPACSGLTLEAGEGAFAFAPRDDGDDITMAHGQQGGWHIDIAGSVTGSSGTVSVVATMTETNQQVMLAGGGQEEGEAVNLVGYDAKTCSGTFFAVRAFIDDVEVPNEQRFICTLEDNAMEVAVTVTDLETGEVATDTYNAIAQLDPADIPVCNSY